MIINLYSKVIVHNVPFKGRKGKKKDVWMKYFARSIKLFNMKSLLMFLMFIPQHNTFSCDRSR